MPSNLHSQSCGATASTICSVRAIGAIAVTTALTSLSPSLAHAEDITLTYTMWDGNQAPVYRQCADKFEAANPGIKIVINQDAWDNYWTTLTTSLVSGTAPDVFVNHLSRFPEFLTNGVMVDLSERIAADQVDMKAYLPGLAEVWNKDGQQWGMPKDWDTIALVYNTTTLALCLLGAMTPVLCAVLMPLSSLALVLHTSTRFHRARRRQ